ncbi:hypothetical protein IFM89_000106 [Coptis chinensis]|uniref:TF-B3 domain-containing protein n=1 Tax=Coptis chinensis TaxID=261450 RepID=A0A835HZM1_9MAGN|nr:hypothetical protein IFM89_000106 [Coptis chinensis]
MRREVLFNSLRDLAKKAIESYLERVKRGKEGEDNEPLMPPQEDIDSPLAEGGGILLPEVEKKIDKAKRKLDEYYYQERVEPNYLNNKKQKKAAKARKTMTDKAKKGEKKKRVSKKERAAEPEIPERMRYFIAKMQGKDLEWVNTKDITLSDTLKQQNRLYMPNEVVEIMRKEETEKNEAFEVHVLDPRGRVWKQNCRYWEDIRRYVLIKRWYAFVQENKLELVNGEKTIEIWSFRNRFETLCFAINIRLREKPASADKKGVGKSGDSRGGHGGGGFTNGASTIACGGSEGDGGAFTNGASTSSSGTSDDNGGGADTGGTGTNNRLW